MNNCSMDGKARIWKTGRRWAAVAAALSVLCGCAAVRDFNTEAFRYYGPYRRGKADTAARRAKALAERRDGSNSAVLWYLEAGAALRAAGRLEESTAAFDRAEAKIDAFDQRAVVSARDLGSAAAAAVSNLNLLPYQGYAYDRIMLDTYKALNYLESGDGQGARVELTRAYERQREALLRHQHALEQARRDAEGKRWDMQRIENSPEVRRKLQHQIPDRDRLPEYALYVNPFTVYLDGVVHLAVGRGNAELERARKSFSRVQAMIGPHPALTADLAAVERRLNGQPLEPTVVVVAELGVAPLRRESRIDLPVPARGIVHVGMALPRLRLQPSDVTGLEVVLPHEARVSTDLLASMDAIIAQEFEQLMPATLARTLVAASLRGIGQYQAGREWGSTAQLGTLLLSTVVNRADLRTWLTLPKEFRLARLPYPPEGRLTVMPAGRGNAAEVTLPPGRYIMVYIKAIEPNTVTVRATTLR